MPSVSPWVTVSSLLPQPAATSPQASRARRSARRRISAGSYRPVRGRGLQAGHRGASATVVVLLEDRLQPLHRLAAPAAEPAAQAEALHDAVRDQRRLRLRRVLDARAAAGRRQRPRAEGLVAVELAAAAGRHDPVGPLDLYERHVGPAEALEPRVPPEPRARAAP